MADEGVPRRSFWCICTSVLSLDHALGFALWMFSFTRGWAAPQGEIWNGPGRVFDGSGELGFSDQCEVLGFLGRGF